MAFFIFSLRAILFSLTAWFFHRAFTPPAKAGTEHEVKRGDGYCSFVAESLAPIAKIIMWGVCAFEVYVSYAASFSPDALKSVCPVKPERVDFATLPFASLIWWALIFVGAGLRLLAFKQMGEFFTFRVVILDNHRLVTDGIYGYMRHPSYTGVMLLSIGLHFLLLRIGGTMRCWAPDVVLWVTESIFFRIYIIVATVGPAVGRTLVEERALAERFGTEWEEYCQKTKRFVPGLF